MSARHRLGRVFSSRPHPYWVLAAILLSAAALRLWGLGFGLPHWWARPDEESIIAPALRMARGDLNPHWFYWPSLYMYAVGGLFALYLAYLRARGAVPPPDLTAFYFANPERFQYIDRGLSAALGVLSVYLLYRLARAFFPPRTALIAAFFLAVAPLHVRDSHFGVTDVPATAMALASLLAIVAWFEMPSPRRLVVAAACCGLTASVKYNAGIVAVSALAALVIRAIDDRAFGRMAIRAAIFAATAAAGFVAGTPYAILDRASFSAYLSQLSEHLDAGHGLDLGVGWQYHLTTTLPEGLGLPLLAASAAGAVWLGVERPRAALLLLSFPLAYYGAAGATQVVFFRYVIPMIPLLCLAAA
jgi:4-amino-4-deoxy-L-arabinose transferase-like glycosyltransferase